MTIGIAVACWGNYWVRYGEEFIASIESMQPRFDEVVIVTKERPTVPDFVRIVEPRSDRCQWDWFNEAVDTSSSEWLAMWAIDDLFFHDGLGGLDLGGDLLSIGCISGVLDWHCPGEDHWKRMLDVNETSIWSSSFIRREICQRFPWRRVVHPDWMQWLEMRYANVDIRFDQKPRFRYRLHSDSHSSQQSPVGNHQVRAFKRMLATGRVIAGTEWPPRGGPWDETIWRD